MPNRADPIQQERARLQEIFELDLLSPELSPLLQDLVARACEELQLPTALVSLVLDGAQYFASSKGLGGWIGETNGTPVEWSFCRYAVEDRAPFIVEDATQHPRVQENPLVRIDGIQCYLGIPLTTSRGLIVGTLCILGTTARTFSERDRGVMQELADEVVERIETRAGRAPKP